MIGPPEAPYRNMVTANKYGPPEYKLYGNECHWHTLDCGA